MPASSPWTFQADARIADRYRIIGLLAQGGMGEVYEAADELLHQPVALKTIHVHHVDDPYAVDRFKREIALARRVTHPNVCRLFDLGQHRLAGDEDAILFLTMELLRGETLSAYLARSGPLSPAAALPLVTQIARGLDAAHQAGVIHRDLKSDNVFLVPDKHGGLRAVITDFGVARGPVDDDALGDRITGTGMIGTPAYMAPEQVSGDPVTAASDLYALGVVLYEMLTGALPFSGETPLNTAVKRLREPPAPPRDHGVDLPASWNEALARCRARAPRARFPSARALVDALHDDEPTAQGAPSGTRFDLDETFSDDSATFHRPPRDAMPSGRRAPVTPQPDPTDDVGTPHRAPPARDDTNPPHWLVRAARHTFD
ncbi:MAG: protein kinase, partial [Acidobacteriota bacterium]